MLKRKGGNQRSGVASCRIQALRLRLVALSAQSCSRSFLSLQHGLAGFQELRRLPELVNTSLKSIHVDRDKISRALPVASRAEQGKVKLFRGEWIRDFLDEATAFPRGQHDDQIDAVSGAFQMIAAKRQILWA